MVHAMSMRAPGKLWLQTIPSYIQVLSIRWQDSEREWLCREPAQKQALHYQRRFRLCRLNPFMPACGRFSSSSHSHTTTFPPFQLFLGCWRGTTHPPALTLFRVETLGNKVSPMLWNPCTEFNEQIQPCSIREMLSAQCRFKAVNRHLASTDYNPKTGGPDQGSKIIKAL
ncbi:hypothetical protein P7K49_034011 [Saguinus oedipus]|uniref:Uncharacterized protein n=1 Tax=Saguinus oedipus TaxID=9490 RepID=A0ABQ9TU18_SAGOE|nr:hypothetical protein P7K49_034011 [Saguinus oedipus]